MMTVRTRIAPSPTGNLHIGTVRTALYNLLFARNLGGEFYFRLEDTDVERSKEEFTQEIINGFRHLGINWDTPLGFDQFLHVEIDADGVVRQSLRAPVHKYYVDKLIKEGKAYKCFATPAELEAMREQQRAQKLPEGYDNRSRNLTAADIAKYEAENCPFVIRLNLGTDRNIQWADAIRGDMSINTKDLGGDPIIMKASGQVLYNFAVVVDDYEMAITHVFRGEDHLTNTAKQIAIYQALGAKVPVFGHLPLIFTKDKQKLSKRKHGDIAGVDKYVHEGYLPDALNNYLIATSYSCSSGNEVYNLEEGIKHFNIAGMSKSPAIYDIQKLNWYNREYMAKLSFSELMEKLKPFSKYDLAKFSVADQELLIDSIRGNLNKFADINENIDYFFEDNLFIDPKLITSIQEAKGLLEALLKLIENNNLDFHNPVALKETINKIGTELNLSGKHLFLPIRAALSGRANGPDLGAVMYLLGHDRCARRLANVIK